jgi:hypothetical protein
MHGVLCYSTTCNVISFCDVLQFGLCQGIRTSRGELQAMQRLGTCAVSAAPGQSSVVTTVGKGLCSTRAVQDSFVQYRENWFGGVAFFATRLPVVAAARSLRTNTKMRTKHWVLSSAAVRCLMLLRGA